MRIIRTNNAALAALACCAVLMTGAAGCSLAQKSGDAVPAQDRLCGLYVTTAPVNVIVPEKIEHARDANPDLDGLAENAGRVYATLVATTRTDPHSPESKLMECRFDGLDGRMMIYNVLDGFDPEYSFTGTGSALEAAYVYSLADQSARGYLNVIAGREMTLYPNPLFQCPDGRVYLVPAPGEHCSGLEGESWKKTFMQSYRYIDDEGEVSAGKSTAELFVDIEARPESVTVFAMDTSGRAVGSFVYDVQEEPSDCVIPKNTAFLVVRTARRAPDGTLRISRETVDAGTDSIYYRSSAQDGFCVSHALALKWPGGTDGMPAAK